MAATFEAVVGLKTTTTMHAKHGTAFDLEFTKYRDKRNDTHAPTTAWLEDDTAGGLRWDFERSEDDRLNTLRLAVLSTDFPRQTDLAKHLGLDPAQITRMKAKAIGKGIMTEVEWERAMHAARALSEALPITTEDDGDDRDNTF